MNTRSTTPSPLFYIHKLGMYFKGSSNFQGILNYILQILHYHCSKQHKNMENLQFSEQNIIISFWHFLCLLGLLLPSPFSTADVFQFLDRVLREK